MRRPGVRLRVAGAFALAMAVLLVVAGLAIRAGLRDEITDATDETLETRATAVARLLVDRGRPLPGISEGIDDPGETFTQVIGPGEEVVVGTPGLPRAPLLDAAGRRAAADGATLRLRGVDVEADEGDEELDTEALEETASEPFEDDRARVLARNVTVGGTRYAIITGATLEDREDAVRALTRVLGIALPLALLGATLAGFLAVSAALRPVERMRRRAAHISDRSLSERLPVPGHDDEIDATRAHAERDARPAGAGAGDRARVRRRREPRAAHAAGDPARRAGGRAAPGALAGGAARHDRRGARRGRAAQPARRRPARDGARGCRAPGAAPGAARRGGLLETVRERFAGRAAELERSLEADAPGAVVLQGDRARLEQALGNLVDNALRHGGGPVTLHARAATAGSSWSSPTAARASRRSSHSGRSSASAAPTPRAARGGAGLGLAIVRAVAVAHGGTARLDARAGGGTEAVLRLPA